MPIPMDPAATTRVRDMHIQLGEQWVLMPGRPAGDWIDTALTYGGSLEGYVPGLLTPADQEMVEEGLYTGDLTYADVLVAAQDAVGVASGFQWWWVGHRLLLALVADWGRLGGLLLRFDPDLAARPLGQVLATLYGYVLEHVGAEAKDRQQFFVTLCMPPMDLPDWGSLMDEVGAKVLTDLVPVTAGT